VRAAEFSKDKSFSGNIGYVVGSIWASATPEEIFGIKTYFEARVQNQDLTRGASALWELREAYAQVTRGPFDFRIGRQISVWGRADKINPTDTWSTRDYTLLAPNDEDQRLGVTSLQCTWNSGTYRVIGIWQPEWRYPSLPIPPLPTGVSVQNIAPRHPARQFGIKLDHSGEGTDWSVSYAHSLDRTPDLAVLSQSPAGASLGFVFREINTAGVDAAAPVGPYGLRAEVAYTRTEDRNGTDPLTKNSNIFAVLGGERTFWGVLNVNVQYLYRRTFNFVEPSSIADPNTRLLAQEVDLLSNQLAPDMQGASLRMNYKAWNETLETELAAVVWFKKTDAAIRPKISYALSDRTRAILGGEIYRGSPQSLFGQLKPTSTAYAELQLSF
jgi:hypothetical protein